MVLEKIKNFFGKNIKKPVRLQDIENLSPSSSNELKQEACKIERHNYWVNAWEFLEKKGFNSKQIEILLNLPTDIVFGMLKSIELSPAEATKLSDAFSESFRQQRKELNDAAVEFEKATGKSIFAHGTGTFQQLLISSILKDGYLKHGKGTIQYGRLVSDWQPAYSGFLFVDIEKPGQRKDKKMKLIIEKGMSERPLETLDKIVVPEEHIVGLKKVFPKYKKKLITFREFAKQLKSMK